MKKILVATDFSNAAKNASIYAAELAKINGAKIILCNVYSQNDPVNDSKVSELVLDEKLERKKQLEKEAAILRNLCNVEVDFLETEGLPIKKILVIEEKENIDLVVIGMKESEALTGFIFGSLITDLIRETRIPIIIIPEKSIFKKIEKIAFAVDFNLEREMKMHKPIKDLLQLFNPEIFVLNVVKKNEEIRPDKKVSEFNIEKYFENRKHIYSFIQDDDLVHGLNEFIAQNKINIITMLPHKHNLFENIFYESKTKQMAFNTIIPLIIFPMDI